MKKVFKGRGSTCVGPFFMPRRRAKSLFWQARPYRAAFWLTTCLASALLCLSCPGCGFSAQKREISILSYNLQCFFDAQDDGTEYPEYSLAKGQWSEALYQTRLDNLERVIAASAPGGPDILCLVELENEAILQAIGEKLMNRGYGWSGFAGGGAATGCAILSRLPIINMLSHGLEEGGCAPRIRPILEAELGREGEGAILIFINHWKSKLEGAEETEGLRRAQAEFLAALIRERQRQRPGIEILACGDLNEEAQEFLRCGSAYATALGTLEDLSEGLRMSPPDGAPLLLAGSAALLGQARDSPSPEERLPEPWFCVSPWLMPGAEDSYSYVYRGQREQIDHFLLSPLLFDARGWEFVDFKVIQEDFLLDEEGKPKAWVSGIKSGYSDHLPILLRLEQS